MKLLRNITIVLACRTADLEYDPSLRNIKYNERITLKGFDFDKVVVPLLNKWNINENQLDDNLRKLLQLPQNLYFFEAIVRKSCNFNIRTIYELHEAYLNETIIKDPNLGNKGINAIVKLSKKLLKSRTTRILQSSFNMDDSIVRRLNSKGVLKIEDGFIEFNHQTLFDYMVPLIFLKKNLSLADFINKFPPFPFLRPFVRTFMFRLRLHSSEIFSRQIKETLEDERIVYHFKRLIVESLTEIVPTANDWPLILKLFNNWPETLFYQFFMKIKSKEWFDFLYDNWLALLEDNEIWYMRFIKNLGRWMNLSPKKVIQLWEKTLLRDFSDANHLAWEICSNLSHFKYWDTIDTKKLILLLLKYDKEEYSYIGVIIRKYIIARNNGHDLLWKYIAKDILTLDIKDIHQNNFEHITHAFDDQSFIKNQLIHSKYFLNIVCKHFYNLLDYSIQKQDYESNLLCNTSYRENHGFYSRGYTNGLQVLLYGLEEAFKYNSKRNSKWWVKYEPKIRLLKEAGIIYLLIQAYIENSVNNITGIEFFLTNKKLLYKSQLRTELGRLMNLAYHFLQVNVREKNQKIILAICDCRTQVENKRSEWEYNIVYNYLKKIPCCFRTKQSQEFIDKYQDEMGIFSTHSYSKSDELSISVEMFLHLTNLNIIKLFRFYNADRSNPIDRLLSNAAAKDPQRFIEFIPVINTNNFNKNYIISIIDGITRHLRYRFGGLKKPTKDWEAVKPLPRRKYLAKKLLNYLLTDKYIWDNGIVTAHALKACCTIIKDKKHIQYMVSFLNRLSEYPDPIEDSYIETYNDLIQFGINSVRGISSETAILLYNHLLERNIEPPESLYDILVKFSCDPVNSVRGALLLQLPYLTSRENNKGWRLFSNIFNKSQSHLWKLVERQLYYQYTKNPTIVKNYLYRIKNEAIDIAGVFGEELAHLCTS